MRPRSFERGNLQPRQSIGVACTNFNEAALFRTRKHRIAGGDGKNYPTTMRPRSFERGNQPVPAIAMQNLQTSMRPRSFERGNARKALTVGVNCKTSMRPRSFERGNENKDAYPAMTSNFNEAALFRTRKQKEAARTSGPLLTSMRPRSFERGN